MTGIVQSRIVQLALILCAAAPTVSFGACASPTAPAQSATWSLTLQLSGGFAGVDRQLDLASSGAATVIDRRRKVTRSARATADETKTISDLVAKARASDLQPPGCADCFDYSLEIRSGASRISIKTNDSGLSTDDTAQLLRALSQLLNRVLAEDKP